MKDYERTDGSAHCHEFMDASSFLELLEAIIAWWTPNDPKPGTVLEAITFRIEPNFSYAAQVFWASIPPGLDLNAEIKSAIERERQNPFGLPEQDPFISPEFS